MIDLRSWPLRRSRLLALLAAALLALGLAGADRAAAQTAPLDWSTLERDLADGFDPASDKPCRRGETECVDAVVAEMTRRFDPLAASCDHDAIFSLTYLRTTEEYRRTIEDPNFFEDTAFVNYEDALFAGYYFDAYDDWHEGRRHAVPAAWRIALRAADRREVKGAGNLYLGMNAHIQRDLPFVLASIGLTKPDGSSRKPDHDKVNVMLARVQVFFELINRFDPTIAEPNPNLPPAVNMFLATELIPTWREIAWQNAERLVDARNPAARARVAAGIEAYAASQALLFRELNEYGPGESSAERDAYCAARQG